MAKRAFDHVSSIGFVRPVTSSLSSASLEPSRIAGEAVRRDGSREGRRRGDGQTNNAHQPPAATFSCYDG